MTGAAPRVVTFGEMLLRLSPPGTEPLLESGLLHAFFGGAEANVAVALQHLGVQCDYVTVLPHGPIGDAALAAVCGEGVGTRWIARGEGRMGLYFVEPGADLAAMRVVYDRAGSAFARLDPAGFDWPAILDDAVWFHATGITPALGAAPAAALADAMRCARDRGLMVSLDLNHRAALWTGRDPQQVIAPLARTAHLLIGNAAAIAAMLGIPAHDDDAAVAVAARELAGRVAGACGSQRVALTSRRHRGGRTQDWCAALYDAGSRSLTMSRTHRVDVVDRVGGGDSFAAGLIAAQLAGRDPSDAVEFAAAAGALKLAIAGDFGRAGVDAVEAAARR